MAILTLYGLCEMGFMDACVASGLIICCGVATFVIFKTLRKMVMDRMMDCINSDCADEV